jgi:HEAT repeat protein
LNPDERKAAIEALGRLRASDAVGPLVAALNAQPEATPAVALALAAIEQRDLRELGEGAHVADAVRARLEPDGLRHLLTAIDTASADVLPALTRVVGWVHSDAAEEMLVTLLSRSHVRDLAIDALVARGEAVVDRLREPADSDDVAVALAAVTTLGRIGSRRATRILVPLLDAGADVAIAAAGALARIGDPDAFDALLEHAGHPQATVRQAVVAALNAIGHASMPERIAVLIDDADPFVRESAVRIAGYFGYDTIIDTLIERTTDAEEAIRVAAVEHMPFVDDERIFETVQRALGDSSARVRSAAARALARIDHPGAHDALLWALGDADLWVRYYAARALGERGEAAAVTALSASAMSDAASHVRIAALDGLGLIGDTDGLSTLVACVEEPDEDIASAALRALGALGAPDALPLLQRGTRAHSIKTRLSAIAGLAADGSEGAVGLLASVAGAEDQPAVFGAAIAALGEVAASSAAGAGAAVSALLDLQGDPLRAEAASTAFARLGAAHPDDLARGLEHPQADVRRKTIEALARMRTPEATQFVARALDDEVAEVRETAVLALMRLGARGVEARLQDLARQDPSNAVRRVAADAAARLRRE